MLYAEIDHYIILKQTKTIALENRRYWFESTIQTNKITKLFYQCIFMSVEPDS